MATIIGITGAIGSGKTTFSQQLAHLEPNHTLYETSQIVSEAGDAFNKALLQEMSFELSRDNTEIVNQALVWFTEDINEMFGHNISWNQLAITKHRLAVHPAHFVKLFAYLDQLKKNPSLAAQPVTSKNKESYRPLLQWLGGYLVTTVSKSIWLNEIFRRIKQRDQHKKLIIINGLRFPTDADIVRSHSGIIIEIIRPNLTALDPDDITEASRTDITPDCRIINNGTLDQLKILTQQLLRDARASKPAPEYMAQQ